MPVLLNHTAHSIIGSSYYFKEIINLNEVERLISNRWLSVLLHLHRGPINVVVYYESSWGLPPGEI